MTALLEAGSSAAYVYDYKATRRRLLGDLGKCSKNMRMLKMMKMKTQIEKASLMRVRVSVVLCPLRVDWSQMPEKDMIINVIMQKVVLLGKWRPQSVESARRGECKSFRSEP